MNYRQLVSRIPEAYENPITTFNADYVSCGEVNAYLHVKRIIGPIQQCCYDMNAPELYAGHIALRVLQIGEFIDGFLTRSDDFIQLGHLSANRSPIVSTVQECSSCGTRANPKNGICSKCGNPHLIRIAGYQIPIYSTSRSIVDEKSRGFDNCIFVACEENIRIINICNIMM